MNKKKIFKIIIIMILIVIAFPYTIVLAAEVATVGNAIATFATNYYNKVQSGEAIAVYHPKNAGYPSGWTANRAIPDDGTPRANPYSLGFDHYALDCVGWVNYCVYNVTGIKFGPVTTGAGGYVVPGGIRDTAHFESVSGPAQPGDILRSSAHVLLCTAPGEGIEMNSATYTSGKLEGPFKTTRISSYSVIRIKKSAAAAIDETKLVTDPNLPAGTVSNIFGGVNQSEFYYNGIPDGKYSVTSANIIDWIVNTLKEIFSFIANLITYIIRMVFVGWTFLVENMLTDFIKTVSGEENVVEINATDYGKNGNKYTDDNVTIERIIFDNVKIFNVDFFNIEETEEETEEVSE